MHVVLCPAVGVNKGFDKGDSLAGTGRQDGGARRRGAGAVVGIAQGHGADF